MSYPPFTPFELEREMSIWENQVTYNLSESGVHPLNLHELVEEPEFLEELLNLRLTYPQTNGTPELRQRIAALYPRAAEDHILVTTGAAQANFTAILTLLKPGDEIVIMLPNYMQIWGIAKNLGLKVKTFSLKEELGWGFDPDELNACVTDQTRLIAVCNPNNPTGHIMTEAEIQAVVDAARRVGAWILSDEVYAGAERLVEEVTPSLYGRYERVLAMGSLSKAYALPGLRLGWVATRPETAEALWARQDYITISTTLLANKIAAYALSPQVRPRILARTRSYIRQGFERFETWRSRHADTYSLVPPEAAAVAFVRYNRKTGSTELTNRLRIEQSAYVVPGDYFGLDHYLRISYGLPEEYLMEGLRRLHSVVEASE